VYDIAKKRALRHSHRTLRQRVKEPVKRQKVLILSGPTAAGKTSCSLSLAEKIGGEIISADSMQVYRGMDIGTAKVTLEERTRVRHHLIDIVDIKDPFNVMTFYNKAHDAIKDILSRDKVPIVVGGTGFYIHALIYGPPCGPPSVASVRKKIEDEMEKQGPEVLYERLQMLDPDYANTITERDRQKIVRALEIIYLSNRKVSSFKAHKSPSDYLFNCWFLFFPKEILDERINARCEVMINEGLIDEVKTLMQKGLLENNSCANAIGYRQAIEFLQGSQSENEYKKFVEAFKAASRQYAKRQFTWFRKKEPLFRCLNLQDFDIDRVQEIILQDFEQS